MSNSVSVAQTYSTLLKFFEDKSRFGQGYYNFDKEGNRCGWKEAYSYCVLGALSFFTEGDTYFAQSALQRVSDYLFQSCIQLVNDDHLGYEKVIMALKFASYLWKDCNPTEEELKLSVSDLLKKRNSV